MFRLLLNWPQNKVVGYGFLLTPEENKTVVKWVFPIAKTISLAFHRPDFVDQPYKGPMN